MLKPYAWPARQLLIGPIYDEDPRLWTALQTHRQDLQAHFEGIGLQLEVALQDGYAFLHDGATELAALEEGQAPGFVLRPLLRRHPLGYETSLLAVLLRHRLGEHDQAGQPGGPKLVVTLGQVQEQLAMLLPPASNQVKFLKAVRGYVRELTDLGFLALRHEDALDQRHSRYEVRRILMARLSLQLLEEFRQALADHAQATIGLPGFPNSVEPQARESD